MKYGLWLNLLLLLVGISACGTNGSDQRQTIDGLWSMQLTFTSGRSGSTAGDLTITQVGTSISLHFQNAAGLTFTTTGTFTKNMVTFTDQYVDENQALNENTYTGQVLPNGTLSGTFTWRNLGIPDLPIIEGTWTAQRQE